MREDLMRELRRVTEEEEQLLAGGQVDKSLYTSGGGFLIDSDKLLAKGKLITVRPHTRFAAFPHAHPQLRGDYVHVLGPDHPPDRGPARPSRCAQGSCCF